MKRTVRGMLTRSMAAVVLVLLYGLSTTRHLEFRHGYPEGRGCSRPRRPWWWQRRRPGIRRSARRARARRLLVGGTCHLQRLDYYDDSCYWSPRRGRYVCPYAYYPGYYRYW